MPSLPQRLSLVRQTADSLREEIARGAWLDWLPGERELAATLLVGRNTLRAALRELAATGLVETRHGAGHRIRRAAVRPIAASKPRSVGLLIPDGLQSLRPGHLLWIDELRALLGRRGLELQIHHQRRFPREPARHACWVLSLCNADLQRRFARAGVPCVIAGTAHPGVALPFVDLDHRSLCRHAAGLLIARGHRRIAFLTRRPVYAGDRESELGFAEGARLSPHPGVSAQIVRHDGTKAGVGHAFRRLLRAPRPPTALLVGDPHHYLTVNSLLAQAGKSVPGDLSLLCRNDAPFLAHLAPEPARYAFPPVAFARGLLRLILRADSAHSPVRLQPRLVRGETLAPPPIRKDR